VVAEVAHRQAVGSVGGEHNVDVLRPQLRQPRQTLRARLRRQLIQTVDQQHQRPLRTQQSGHSLQRRRKVVTKVAVCGHSLWIW